VSTLYCTGTAPAGAAANANRSAPAEPPTKVAAEPSARDFFRLFMKPSLTLPNPAAGFRFRAAQRGRLELPTCAPTRWRRKCIATVPPMRLPTFIPTASGEWSPALPGLDHLRLKWVVLVQLVVTVLMVGMIWTVHVVHYDLFPLVGADSWDAYESAHVDRIGKVLFGPWLIEGICVLVLLLAHPKRLRVLALAGAFLMLFILIDTAAFSAPAHGVLLDHWDQQTYDELMTVNLIRAWLWTAKGAVAVWMMVEVLRSRPEQIH
jgi:hypothetical protein